MNYEAVQQAVVDGCEYARLLREMKVPDMWRVLHMDHIRAVDRARTGLLSEMDDMSIKLEE